MEVTFSSCDNNDSLVTEDNEIRAVAAASSRLVACTLDLYGTDPEDSFDESDRIESSSPFLIDHARFGS